MQRVFREFMESAYYEKTMYGIVLYQNKHLLIFHEFFEVPSCIGLQSWNLALYTYAFPNIVE